MSYLIGETDKNGDSDFELLGGKIFPYGELIGAQLLGESPHVVAVYREKREELYVYYEAYPSRAVAEGRVEYIRSLMEIQ